LGQDLDPDRGQYNFYKRLGSVYGSRTGSGPRRFEKSGSDPNKNRTDPATMLSSLIWLEETYHLPVRDTFFLPVMYVKSHIPFLKKIIRHIDYTPLG
jgi:hypothetical protein